MPFDSYDYTEKIVKGIMSGSQPSLSARIHPSNTESISSSNGISMMNKPNNFPKPPSTPPFRSNESALVNGHPSLQGSHSNSSSRHHSPTPYSSHPDGQVGNVRKLSGPCLNSDINKLASSVQGNIFQDQFQSSIVNKSDSLNRTENGKLSDKPTGIPNIQSSPNFESVNFNNKQSVPVSSQNNNLNSSISNPAFSNNLSFSETNLSNGGSFLSRKHIYNNEASSGNNFMNKSPNDGPSLIQSASLSSLDKSASNFASSNLQTNPGTPSTNTSKLFPSRELASGNKVLKSSPSSSPLPSSARHNSADVIGHIPLSASGLPTSSTMPSNYSNQHALLQLPAKVSGESALHKSNIDTFQGLPSVSSSNIRPSVGPNIGSFPRPSTFVGGSSSRPTVEQSFPSFIRPPPSPVLRPPTAPLIRYPSSMSSSPSVPITSPFLSKNEYSLASNIGPQSSISSNPSVSSVPSQTHILANSSSYMYTSQPKTVVGPRPMQASAIGSMQSSGIVSPQSLLGPSPTSPRLLSITGQPSVSMLGPPSKSVMGQPPIISKMGPPPTSAMGLSPSSPYMGQHPSASLISPPPTSMIGPSPKSIIGPPPTSMVGPPPMSMIGSPSMSMSGPPPLSLISPPPSSMIGPPPLSMLSPLSTATIGPPPTSIMGISSKSTIGLNANAAMVQSSTNMSQAALILQPPSTSIGYSSANTLSSHAISGMSSQSTTNLKYPSITRPPSNSVLSPPPTAMVASPSSVPQVTGGLNLVNHSTPNSAGISSVNNVQSSIGNSNRYPVRHPPQSPQVNQLSQQLGGLSVTKEGWNKNWGTNCVDLLQQKTVIPPQGVVPPKPVLLQEYLPNCSPEIFRCTISKVPETQSVLQKSRLPFGIVIHPFKDLEHLAVVSCNTIVRCRSCRTYINPFVVFKGDRRWECNLCFRVNDLPDEFQFDPLTRTYGDPSRRPEVREATIEFIAPQEYMLRPPQPATYIWVLDVSRQAVETGYLKVVCDTLLNCLDKIPGDRRALIGFITFSTTVQFYLMGEGQKSVHMLDVGEIDDIFIPSPDDLLVHLDESRNLIEELLNSLPETHNNNVFTQTAFGAALTAAYKLLCPIGGRITAMAVTLPTIGPGALKPREDPNQRSAKNINHLGPATDFYKKLALDCSGQQIAVDLFTFNSQYIDLATLSGVSRFSGGCMHHFPGFNVSRNPASVEPFKSCLTRYITRKIGFEAVMRIRTTRGLDITNFHGNFFVRSTDLLSLPNINPDSGFGMQLSIEEPLHNIRQACFQAALLYTSSKGERRIRVHTLCLPVCPNIHEVIAAGDQQAIVDLLAKMAVDRCLSSQMSDAREAIVNTCSDIISAYKASLSTSSVGLPMPTTLQALPLYLLALLKSVSLRYGISTKLDDRVFAMFEIKTLPLKYLIQSIYPDLYAISYLSEIGAINIDDMVIPQPDHLQLSGEYIDRDGAYLMDVGSFIYVYIRSGISSDWVNEVVGVPSFAAIPQPLYEDPFPSLDNPTSELVRNFIFYLQRKKPFYVPVYVIREDNPSRNLFLQYLVDDRSEGTHSYVEFLQFLKPFVK